MTVTEDATLAYRESELTTDPVGLVVVLYDILLRDLRTAIACLDRSDIEQRTEAVRHAMLVLQQLQGTLDFECGGVVAENLDRYYDFTRAKLLEGQIKQSREIFDQQIALVGSIREAWLQVQRDQQAAATGIPPGMLQATAHEAQMAADWSA